MLDGVSEDYITKAFKFSERFIKYGKRTIINQRTMEMNKYCLVVWIFLFANAVYCRTALAVDEEVYDDAPKSEAQSYFDLIPEEGEQDIENL